MDKFQTSYTSTILRFLFAFQWHEPNETSVEVCSVFEYKVGEIYVILMDLVAFSLK
jgi:hypothetical protein